MKKVTYEKLYDDIEKLQFELMDIDNYSEEVYQAFENLLDALDEVNPTLCQIGWKL